MTQHRAYLYPQCTPNHQGTLQVTKKHTLHWEESGNPNGKPILFLHGGPGGRTSPHHRRFFDPAHYRILMFDQRGAGKSTPKACIEENTPQDLVNDIEALRMMWQIDKWHVFGGSWGSTLALAYAQAHPDRVSGLILRGIFTMRQKEIDWLMQGIQTMAPDSYQTFISLLPEEERATPLESYYQRLTSSDPITAQTAAEAWASYEKSLSSIYATPADKKQTPESTEDSLALARIEAHYMRNNLFTPQDKILKNIDSIRHIPTILIQGRYDLVCPPTTAWELHQKWPEAELQIIPDAGHSSQEPGTLTALVIATERMKYADPTHNISQSRPSSANTTDKPRLLRPAPPFIGATHTPPRQRQTAPPSRNPQSEKQARAPAFHDQA